MLVSYAILCDSTADLLPEEQESLGIAVIPLFVNIDGREYADQVEISSYEFYERLKVAKDRPRSSQPTPMNFMQAYERLFEQGFDQVISIHIAAPLSGTVESARMAAAELDKPIAVIDSCAALTKTALLAKRAAKLRDAGVSFEDAVSQLKESVASVTFMLACDTLDALVAGGRLSAEDAKAAGALNIKPILSFNETGVLQPVGKVRGMKGVVKHYAQAIADATAEHGKQTVRFCHADNMSAINDLKDMLAEMGVDYEDAGCAPAGATITTHTGMGAIGFSCMPA